MLNILPIVAPIFLLIGAGFAAVQSGAMAKADIRPLGRFVIGFALPALIFKSLAGRPLADIMNPAYLAAYGGGSALVFALLFAVARAQGRGLAAAAVHGAGGSLSNSGFIGYPVTALVLGPAAVTALALNMIVENMLILPILLVIAESGSNGGKRWGTILAGLALRLVKNPLIIAICGGAAVSVAGLVIPQPVAKALDMLALASGAIALFVIGGTLAGASVKGMLGDAVQIALAKLLLMPLVVFAGLALVPPVAPDMVKAALIYAGVPMVTVYPLLGMPYGQEEKCAAALTFTTAVSFFTLPVLLALV